jgi:DNA-directed RNA polymerase specialized sigma24 family protein
MARPGFEQFVGESLPALMRHALALTGDVHAGEDLVQDTLVRMAGVWRRIDREGNPQPVARAAPPAGHAAARRDGRTGRRVRDRRRP